MRDHEKRDRGADTDVPGDTEVHPGGAGEPVGVCLLYTSPSPRDRTRSRMPSSA